MNETGEARSIRLTRAEYVGHDDEARLGAPADGAADLLTDRLHVGWNLVECPVVTLSFRTPGDAAYCLEFDITPDSARELAVDLSVAATFSERRPREVRAS